MSNVRGRDHDDTQGPSLHHRTGTEATMPDLHDTSRLISISLHQAGPPISGTVSAGAEPPRSFTGWVGLLAELQAAVGETDEAEKSSWSRPR